MRVAIIGIQGVGMAHAIAAERLGFEVTGVLDVDPAAEQRLRGPWVNAWGPYRDEIAEPKSRPIVTTDMKVFDKVLADCLIIATPTETHIGYLLRYGHNFRKVLVEKPLSYSMEQIASVGPELRAKTYVGHKWLSHPGFPTELRVPFGLLQGHAFPPPQAHKSRCGVVWDLGVHAFAHLLSRTEIEIWHGLRIDWSSVTQTAATVGIAGVKTGVIHVCYNDIGPGEVMVDGHLLHWTDLFEKQLRRLDEGTHPAPFALGAKACEMANSLLPMDKGIEYYE